MLSLLLLLALPPAPDELDDPAEAQARLDDADLLDDEERSRALEALGLGASDARSRSIHLIASGSLRVLGRSERTVLLLSVSIDPEAWWTPEPAPPGSPLERERLLRCQTLWARAPRGGLEVRRDEARRRALECGETR